MTSRPPTINLAKIVLLYLLALVQPTVQTDLNGITSFDGLAGALGFRKKFDTGPKHHVVWHVTTYVNGADTPRNKYPMVVPT
jgi:hypothetical protein